MGYKSNLTFAVHTLGCKVNFTETSGISDILREKGYRRVTYKEVSDIYVINSCVLTSAAEKKTRNAIYRAHRLNPNAKIAVIGCVSELFSESLKQIEGVSLILGNDAKFFIADFIGNENNIEQVVRAGEIDTVKEFRLSYSLSERTRSFVKIQDGCDCFCHYCIVPYARGRSRSATISEVMKAVSTIAEKGYKEIVLTGINLGDFGKDNNENLIALLEAIIESKALQRIRLSSIEPQFITQELIEFFSSHSEMMPHFHIPMQSGSDATLQRMGRNYNTAFLSEIIKMIIDYIPKACIAADVITGFPGETDDEFKQTIEFFSKNPIAYMHVFTFSARTGTHAISIPEQVHADVKKHRTKVLSDISQKNKTQFYKTQFHQPHKVLIETEDRSGWKYGHTENYLKVKVRDKVAKPNSIVQVVPISYDETTEIAEVRIHISNKKTLVIGASTNTYRYSYKAVKLLLQKGYKVEAYGNRIGTIEGIDIHTSQFQFVDIHTVTLYLNIQNQKEYYDYILYTIQPKRIIFNHGTENPDFEKMAKAKGIEVVKDCTLVMLTTNRY